MMGRDRVLPTAVALGAYAVMSALLTPIGVILLPLSKTLGASITETGALFSALTGGNFIGIVLCFVLFEYVSLRIAISAANAAMLIGIALLALATAPPLAAVGLGFAGVGSGVGLSSGAVIIARIYARERRAMAFLGTDCAFSVAGLLFPSLAALSLARGFAWQTVYLAAAIVCAAILIAAQRIRFPNATGLSIARETGGKAVHPRRALVCAGFCGAALCAYLIGQGSFLLWAPTTLHLAGVAAPLAGTVVARFWGPSIFGLLTAAVVVTRIRPRVLLIVAGTVATVLVALLSVTTSAATFFTLTACFGFFSTSMYKLMISVGSEQLADAPPRLVTFLLVCGSLGSTVAPALSAWVAASHGPRSALTLAWIGYAAAVGFFLIALAIERASHLQPGFNKPLEAHRSDAVVS